MGDVFDTAGAGKGAVDFLAGKSIYHQKQERISPAGRRGFCRVRQTYPSESKKKTESADDLSYLITAIRSAYPVKNSKNPYFCLKRNNVKENRPLLDKEQSQVVFLTLLFPSIGY